MDNNDFNPKQPLPDLIAIFRMKRGLLRREQVAVHVYALDEKGCVIKTDEVLAPGDEVRLALSLKMPFENASTPLFFGRVLNVRKYCSNFFYKVDFIEHKRQQSCTGITRILDLLKRKVALTERRKGGSHAGRLVRPEWAGRGADGLGRQRNVNRAYGQQTPR